mgnify:CR=1 FL=1
MRKQILFVLFSLATLSIHADEGMWMLTDLKTQNAVAMRELGLEIPIEEVYDANGLSLKDAVVHFGGGCTGEIISSEGLVLTNHHCGYGAIQQHSNVEHDYLTDGFWAMKEKSMKSAILNFLSLFPTRIIHLPLWTKDFPLP